MPTVKFTPEQILILRRGFDAGAPIHEDFATRKYPVKEAVVDVLRHCLCNTYTATPQLEFSHAGGSFHARDLLQCRRPEHGSK